MGNEDYYALDGPGGSFRGAFHSVVKSRSAAETMARRVVQGIRNQIRRLGGPRNLVSLGIRLGLLQPGEAPPLPLWDSPDNVRQAMEDHKHSGGPTEELEVKTLQWARALVKNGAPAPTAKEALLHFCEEIPNAMFFSRVHSDVRLSTIQERNEHIEAARAEMERLLRGTDSDIVTSLLEDPSGKTVKEKLRKPHPQTATMVNEKVEILMPIMMEP